MRLSAKAPIVIRGEEITHLDADGYKHLPRATALPDGKVLATSGGKWGASDLSGVSVASVFGRTGAVTAQAGDYTSAQVGAEPYAGAPAQTSFWRSTAAGVRAWVQLVAADITDLATTLANYLPKLNPTYTGRLTGPTQYLEADEQILLAIRRPGGQSGRIHGIAFQAQNDASAWVEFGRLMTYISSVTAGAHTGGMRLMAYKDGAIFQALEAGPGGVRVGANLPLQMGMTTIVDASRNITGATLKGGNLTGTGNRPLVAGADGTIDDQDAATFRGTIGALASSLKGVANGVAELGADGKVPSAQLPASTLPTDPVFDTVTTTGAAYIGTNLDVSGNAVVDGWASIAGSLQAADARFTNLSHALGGTATQLPGASESGNLVASGLSTTAGSTGNFLVRKYRTLIGPLGAADYSVSTGGGLFVSSETLTAPILALGHGSEVIALIADVRFAQVVAAGKTGAMPAMKAQIQVQTIGSGGSVGGYGARVTHRVRGDNANDLTDVLELESSQVAVKIPLRTDSACHNKVAIRTATTTTAANNHVVIFDGLGDRTETLPAATGSNRVLVMKNRSSAYSWTLDGDESETIDGAATLVLTANQCATLIDYASGQWAVIGKVG